MAILDRLAFYLFVLVIEKQAFIVQAALDANQLVLYDSMRRGGTICGKQAVNGLKATLGRFELFIQIFVLIVWGTEASA